MPDKVLPMFYKMPTTIKLEPTADDVRNGVCNSPTKCMYAIFLRRKFPRASNVSVNPNCITITVNGVYYHYTIPMKGVVAMADFDKYGNELTAEQIAAAQVTATLANKRKATYISTPEVRAKHRIKSAIYRARPEYDPRSKATLRAIVARSRLTATPARLVAV